jgi:DNA-binding transcriptional regulator YhcF (GntR family)
VNEERGGPGGGKVYERVMATLRDRLADGTYPLNSLLPVQRKLAPELDTSRQTLARVLRDLENEGWLETLHGSGTRVIKVEQPIRSARAKGHQANLGQLMEEAFSQQDVTLDVYSFTAETLARQFDRLDDRIREHKQDAPRRIALRLMLPQENMDMPYPQPLDPESEHREAIRERHRGIARQKLDSIRNTLLNLHAEKLVDSLELEIRHVPLVPTVKLYLLNGTEVLWGPYNVVERRIHLEEAGVTVDALDVLGVGGDLQHLVTGDAENTQAAGSVASWQSWFDSVWDLLGDR